MLFAERLDEEDGELAVEYECQDLLTLFVVCYQFDLNNCWQQLLRTLQPHLVVTPMFSL
jgi:hypothetical protein